MLVWSSFFSFFFHVISSLLWNCCGACGTFCVNFVCSSCLLFWLLLLLLLLLLLEISEFDDTGPFCSCVLRFVSFSNGLLFRPFCGSSNPMIGWSKTVEFPCRWSEKEKKRRKYYWLFFTWSIIFKNCESVMFKIHTHHKFVIENYYDINQWQFYVRGHP